MNDDGGLAFPFCNGEDYFPGMTRRQWLAGLAMQGLLSNSLVEMPPEGVVKWALKMADAMLAAETSQQEENQQ